MLWTRAIHSLFLTLVQALPMTQLTAWSCLSPSPSQDQMPPTSLHDRSTLLALASPSSSVQPYFRHCPFPLFLHDLVNVTNYSHSSPWLVPRVPLVSRPASPSPASCAPVLSLATLHTIPEMWPPELLLTCLLSAPTLMHGDGYRHGDPLLTPAWCCGHS